MASSNSGDKKTARIQFDVGEQEKNQSDSLSRRQAQTHFLVTISQTYPRVLKDLLDIFDDYWDFAFTYLEKNDVPCPSKFTLANIVELCPSWEIIKTIDEAIAIRSKLLNWSQRYSLNADWCLDRAVKTLQLWVINKEIMLLLGWYVYFDETFLHAASKAKQNPESIIHNWQALLCNDELIDHRSFPLPSDDELKIMKALTYLVYQGDSESPAKTPVIETRETYSERAKLLAKYDVESTRLRIGKRSIRLKLINSVTDQAQKSFDQIAKSYDERPEWQRVEVKSISLRDLLMTVGFQVVGKSYQELARDLKLNASNVHRQINKTLKLIGLKPRISRRVSVRAPRGTLPRRRNRSLEQLTPDERRQVKRILLERKGERSRTMREEAIKCILADRKKGDMVCHGGTIRTL